MRVPMVAWHVFYEVFAEENCHHQVEQFQRLQVYISSVSITVRRRGNADILMAIAEAIPILMSLVCAETHHRWHHQTHSRRSRRFSQSMESNNTAHEWDETKF